MTGLLYCADEGILASMGPPSKTGTSLQGERLDSKGLYQEVAQRLRERIFSHELAPGTWIDEKALAQAFGISRTPMREALKELAGEGLVILTPRRGCKVVQLSTRDIEEVFPVLALLESQCAFEATGKIRPKDLPRLKTLHETLEIHTANKDRGGWLKTDQDFHSVLYEISGNRWLLRVISDLRKVVLLARYYFLVQEGRLEQSLEEHRQIMAAICRQDAAAVRHYVYAHLISCGKAMSELQLPATPTESALK
jgi:DNA-binding GntR family transcriptional regulator